MGALLSFVSWLAVRRVRAGWRLLLASVVAVLFAAVVISTAVLYADGLARAGLRHTLEQLPAELTNAQVAVLNRLVDTVRYEELRGQVEPDIEERLGWLLRGVDRYGMAMPLPVVTQRSEEATRSTPLKAAAFFFTGFDEHAHLVDGRWPVAPSPDADPEEALEVAIGSDAARRLGWGVGTRRFAAPLLEDASANVGFVVVGLMAPNDTDDEYWFTNLTHFDLQVIDPDEFVSLYMPERTVLEALGGRYPLLGNFWWHVFLDEQRVTPPLTSTAIDALEGLEADVNEAVPRSYLFSRLVPDLQAFQRRLALAQVPVFLFASLVVGALLYYLFLLTGLLSRARGPETALLRSRGAALAHVGVLAGLGEGLLVATPAVLLGPPIAWVLTRVLLSTGTAARAEAVPLNPEPFAWSGAVGLLSLAVLSGTTLGVAGRGIIEFLRERARPPTAPLLYRCYLDFLVLALVGLVWWQIQGRGGFVSARLLGRGVEIDPTLLLAPLFALLAAGLLFLRVWPLLLRGLSRLLAPIGSVALLHAARRTARDPVGYGAMAVLLAFAVALGVFGAVFGATVLAARRDQVAYAVGGDLALHVTSSLGITPDAARKAIFAVPEVRAMTPISRTNGLLGLAGATTVTVLGVDPAGIPRTAWFRADLADRGLAAILNPLAVPLPSEQGLPLHPEAVAVSIWTRTDARPSFTLWARFRDTHGRYGSLSLGPLETAGWTRREATLGDLPALMTPPYSLASVFISGPRIGGGRSGTLAVDDIAVTVAGEEALVEGFEGLATNAFVLPTAGTVPDTVAASHEAARTGRGGLAFAWEVPLGDRTRGFVFPTAPAPLPALGSRGLPAGRELVVTVQGTPIPVRILATAEYFPSLDPGSPFLVMNLEHLREYFGAFGGRPTAAPNIYWVTLDPSADRDAVTARLRSGLRGVTGVVDSAAEMAAVEADPLTVAGWRGLALLALVALGGSSIMGLGIFAWLTVLRARVELVVLRVLGLTRRQVVLLLGVEHGLVAIVGLALGGGLGIWLGRWVLDFLAFTRTGAEAVPPVLLTSDGWLLSATLLGTVGAAVVAVGLSWGLSGRLTGPEVLREER